MPVYDAVFVGKIHLPEVGGGPIIPPGVPPSGNVPMPPIYYPPVISGGPGWLPPMVGGGPIIPPGSPPVIAGGPGWLPPMVGGGPIIPGVPPSGNVPMPPIYYPPVFPSFPIVLPPDTIPGLKPEHPIVLPPPSSGNVPAHPIVLPPPGSTEPPEVLANWDVKTAWTAQTGWIVAIVPSESHPGVPTPSAKKP